MLKKIFATLLCSVIIFSLGGCIEDSSLNSSSDDDFTNDNSTNEEVNADNTNYVVFGLYEQDGNSSNGPDAIEWIPLIEEDGKTLLISRYILDYKGFNDTVIAKATSWKNSSLRSWLNGSFFETAFSDTEQKKIQTTQVQDYKADNVLGEVTSDKVFLMSKEQAFTYFSTNSERATTATTYAESQKRYPTNGYWLIDSYTDDLYKRLINSEGKNENNPRVNESEGIRPMIWIED